MKVELKVGEVLDFAWDRLKEHFWKLVGISVVAFFPQIIFEMLKKSMGPIAILFVVILLIFSFVVNLGQIRIALKLVQRNNFKFKEAFPTEPESIINFIGVLCVTGLFICIGLILFVIPGIYFAYKYLYASYFVIDQKMSIGQALEASAKLTHGYKWQLMKFTMMYLLIILVGVMAFGIGLCVAIPMVWISKAYIFEKLRTASNERVEGTMFVPLKDVSGQTP